MEGNGVCDEDGNQVAVCCCICRYPLPNLCVEHLLKHNTDTELLNHFHLPLYAARLIDSMETKNCCELWLFKLHKTYRNLRAQCHDLDRVEERLESLRQELFHQIDEETSKAAVCFRHLRQELTAHVEAAIEATSTHALEQWVPDTELSHLIWHFDINNPASLVTVSIGKREIGNTLQVSATSQLESLQHLTFSESPGNNLAAFQCQFEEVICENSALKAEVARLQEEAEKLRQACSAAVSNTKLAQATAALKLAEEQIQTLKSKLANSARTHATEIEALRQQIVKMNSESVAEAAARDAKVAALKRECDVRVNELKSQVLSLQEDLRQEKLLKKQVASLTDELRALREKPSVLKACLDKGLALKRDRRYQESYSVLQQGWMLAQEMWIVDKDTTALGLELSDLMALRMGRFSEAEVVVRLALQISEQIDPASDDIGRLQNALAAYYYHNERNLECIGVCNRTLEPGSPLQLSAETYWTAVYYSTLAHCDAGVKGDSEVEERLRKPAETALAQALQLSAKGRLALANARPQDAEKLFLQAERLAAVHSPTSIFAVMNEFLLSRAYCQLQKRDLEVKKLNVAKKNFASYFPASVKAAHCLTWLAAASRDMGQLDAAVKTRLQAHNLFSAHHADCLSHPLNLCSLADLYRELDLTNVAIDKRLEADQLFKAKHPSSIHCPTNISKLADLYQAKGQLSNAVDKKLEAHRLYQFHHATHLYYPLNLVELANLYRDMNQLDLAVEKRLEAHAIYEANHPTNINYPNNLCNLADLMRDLGRIEEAVAKRNQAHAIYETHFSTNLSCATNLSHLADLYRRTGQVDVAVKHKLAAYALYKAHHSTHIEHPLNLTELAECYSELGQRERAVEVRRQANRIYRTHHSADLQYPLNLMQLADLYKDIGQVNSAIKKREKAARVLVREYPASAQRAVNLCELATLLEACGKYSAAAGNRQEAHSLYEAAAHPNTARNLTSLAKLHLKMQRLDAAERYCTQAKDWLDTCSPTSNEAAENLFVLAQVHQCRDRPGEALKCVNGAWEVWTKNKSECAHTLARPLLDSLNAASK